MNMAIRPKSDLSRKAVIGLVIMAFALNPVIASAAAPSGPREMSPLAKPTKYDSKVSSKNAFTKLAFSLFLSKYVLSKR